MLLAACVMFDRPPDVSVNGAPDDQRNSAPNCHCPTICCAHPRAPLKNARFSPNGRAHVPLLVTMCVRWKLRTAMSRFRLLGLRVVPPLDMPSVLLHV